MIEIYAIEDTETGSLWETPLGKALWAAEDQARNIWNYYHNSWGKKGGKFAKQNRYRVITLGVTKNADA